MKSFPFTRAIPIVLFGWLVLLSIFLSHDTMAASEFQFIHSLGKPEGTPYGKLVRDSAGNLYGTTYYGGSNGAGTVFKIDSSGSFSVLHEFDGAGGGANPYAGLIQGSDGNFYGTTVYGGTNGAGIIFKIDSTGNFDVLHEFDGDSGGENPYGNLIQASDGHFYGTTYFGGSDGAGTVYRIDSAGNFSVLHNFAYGEASGPQGGLVQGSDGILYGTTSEGGSYANGTFFKLALSGEFNILYEFEGNTNGNGNYGTYPQGNLIQASDGSFYGTTVSSNGFDVIGTVYKIDASGIFTHLAFLDGISNDGLIQAGDGNFYISGYYWGIPDLYGWIYKMDASGTLSLLHQFTGGSGGAYPFAALVQGSDGRLYGTTTGGGSFGSGTVFQLDLSGNFQVLHEFEGTAISTPDNLIQASDGSFYGTTNSGGSYGFGTVFKRDTSGNVSILHSFDGYTEGAFPSSLTQGSDGSFYGTTSGGYLDYWFTEYVSSTIFKIDPDGNFSLLHTFDYNSEGDTVYAGLIQATDGNFYGTAYYGGSVGDGTVFKMDPASGIVSVVHEFDGFGGGANPGARLTQGADGSLYGTATGGGNKEGYQGAGIVFKLDLAGNFSVLHVFDGASGGSYPNTPLIQGADGSLYGTTSYGGNKEDFNGAGTVFKIDANGNFSILHEFDGAGGGSYPNNLIQGTDDSFYGSTEWGGDNGYGILFKLDHSGNFSVLHAFDETDGSSPSDLIAAGDGSFYGSTNYGGQFNGGTLFRFAATIDDVAITLGSSANPSLLRKAVTFTATVTGNNPSGTVEFLDGGTSLGTAPVTNGIATLSTSRLKVGNHSITAVYSGDVNNASSTSAPLLQVVKVATRTVLRTIPRESVVGERVTFSATIRGRKPTGIVEFFDGAHRMGSVALGKDSRAKLSTSTLSPGIHRVSARYRGDSINAPSSRTELIRVVR